MMASPALTYSSPSDSHTPIGSPAPSQLLLHRVASPNHLASQHAYVDSPRSVPIEYSQQYSAPTEQHFEYEQAPEMYVNEDPHIYDLGPNGALPVDPQFVQPQLQQSMDANNMLFMSPAVQLQPPTPMHGQFANHMQTQVDRNSMTPFSDTASDYGSVDSPDIHSNQLIDISASGFALPSQYMTLPRSHPMQGRYYDSPCFDDDGYDSRSPSPGIREQVKRPLNAFMLYRKDKQAEIPTSNHQSVSRIIGAMWKNESADTKAKYNALAQQEREKHRLAYPGYKYSPKKRINKDKKVRRTMSQAAHAKRQEEEMQILRQINKRSKSEGTLTKPLPEYLPIPKSKQPSVTPEDRTKSRTPAPESNPRFIPQPRSHSAQPPSSQDYSKYTSNPQHNVHTDASEETLAIPQGFTVPSQMITEPYEPYFAYPADYAHLSAQNGDSADTPFESETESFSREFSTDPNHLVCSPSSFTPFDESQLYSSFAQRDDIEIFRMNSPFATDPKQEMDPHLQNPRVQNVFAGHWSRESTVNPQDLLAQPDN